MSEKKSTWIIKFLILLIVFCADIANLVMPVLSNLSQIYPTVSENIIIMANTMHYLTGIPTSMFCAALCRKWGTKKMVLISMLLQGLGGAIPVIFSSFSMVLVSRALFGLGWGILMTTPLTLVGEYLPLSEQAGFVGIVMAIMALGASVFTMLGGALSDANIVLVWLTHLLSVAFCIPVILYFPKNRGSNIGQPGKEETKAPKGKTRIPVAFYILFVLNIILSGVTMQGMNMISFFVEDKGLGGATLAASILTAFQVASFISGFIAGFCVKTMKKFTALVSCALCGAFLIGFGLSASVAMLFISQVLFGLASNVVNSLMYVHNSWVVPAESMDIATSITSGGTMGAGFFLVYIPPVICQLLGFGNNYTVQYIIIGAVYVLIGVAFTVLLHAKGVKENVDKVLAESYGK